VAIAALITMVMAVIAVDMTIVTISYANLDSTTRDAARAAAAQNTSAGATNAAISQLSVHKTDGVFCHQPQLVGNALTVYQDWSGAPYNGTAPTLPNSNPATTQCAYVTVQCSESVHLPVPVPFFGTNIVDYASGSGITFYRSYTYPIVHVTYQGS
jgi:Flp pilus assembly protein TadG